MPATLKTLLFGACWGLFVGAAVEAIRYGLGERRSWGEVAGMVIALAAVGAVTRLMRTRGRTRTPEQDDQGGKRSSAVGR